MYYGGLRFCGYEDVVIQGNTFIKEAEGNSTRYRENGCFLINAYCYNNTKETLDLNSDITLVQQSGINIIQCDLAVPKHFRAEAIADDISNKHRASGAKKRNFRHIKSSFG